ncbi:MAG: hypothetical protein NTZ95_04080 [Candidatus Omnitrophica bacterium]|nr:hypothetical protein [Candidatus Omnitrophota bacterium]
MGGGGGTAIGSPFGHAGTGAIIGAEAGALGGALIGAFICAQQQANQRGNYIDPSRLSQPPRWTISEEAIIFDRAGTAKCTLVERVPGAVPFANIPTTPGIQALNSTDFNQGFSAGLRLGATYHADHQNDLSLSFFRSGNWDSTKSVGPDNPLNWLVMRAPGGFFQTQDFAYQSMQWDYSTELYNAELNVQHKISNRINILVGFRWLQLHENLQGTIPPADIFQPTWKSTNPYYYYNLFQVAQLSPGQPAPAYPPFWNTSTTNNLYGFQIGVDGKIFERGHFSISGLIKGGPYLNHASELTGVSIAKTVYESGASANHAAFVGEGGLQCKYQVASGITLKLGYEVLWLAGVALAPGQIRETYSISSPTSVYTHDINSGSNVLFHGVTAGLEFSF